MKDDDKWWEGVKELAKENHRLRVEKTPERIEYATKRFDAEGIKWTLKNKQIGHFHLLDADGNLFQFWASTGKILFDKRTKEARGFKSFYPDYRGIESCIKLIKNTKGAKQMSKEIRCDDCGAIMKRCDNIDWNIANGTSKFQVVGLSGYKCEKCGNRLVKIGGGVIYEQ